MSLINTYTVLLLPHSFSKFQHGNPTKFNYLFKKDNTTNCVTTGSNNNCSNKGNILQTNCSYLKTVSLKTTLHIFVSI